MEFDRSSSGCEWWAQIREPTADQQAAETIGMHWDKDEQLNVAVGGATADALH